MARPHPVYAYADDGTPLHWLQAFAPGTGVKPKVLLIHGGEFMSGDPGQICNVCAPALNAAGYDCFSIETRLAPPGQITGQKSDGRYPCQTDDAALAVSAALKFNAGKVFILGGSSGGCVALYLAAMNTPGVSAVAALSPVTQCDDPKSLLDPKFNKAVNNYAPGELYDASPNRYLAADCIPVALVAFTRDHIPAPQFALTDQELTKFGIDHQSILLPGAGHSIDAWPYVQNDVIAFFNKHL